MHATLVKHGPSCSLCRLKQNYNIIPFSTSWILFNCLRGTRKTTATSTQDPGTHSFTFMHSQNFFYLLCIFLPRSLQVTCVEKQSQAPHPQNKHCTFQCRYSNEVTLLSTFLAHTHRHTFSFSPSHLLRSPASHSHSNTQTDGITPACRAEQSAPVHFPDAASGHDDTFCANDVILSCRQGSNPTGTKCFIKQVRPRALR